MVCAQYAPPAGQEGTTAIASDSSLFFDWANSVEIFRGSQNIANSELGNASYGQENSAIGAPDASVVSLGDGGSALYSLEIAVVNAPGNDFAVFENSFSPDFLELAFVEVSSDGERFVRFPAVSLTQYEEQIGGFGVVDATKIYNLAGKYQAGFGTPFDLDDLVDSSGINLNKITHIKIIDVIGTIAETYASRDSENNIINDPWPTPFASSGFDLDAVGIIHNEENVGVENLDIVDFQIYPNPCINSFKILDITKGDIIDIFDVTGKRVYHSVASGSNKIDVNVKHLDRGMFFVVVRDEKNIARTKKIVKQ